MLPVTTYGPFGRGNRLLDSHPTSKHAYNPLLDLHPATKHAKNVNSAISLLEFLVTDESQKWYAEVNNEYPVVEGAEISKTLKSFGSFKADSINLTILGVNNPKAVKLMDRAGWR